MQDAKLVTTPLANHLNLTKEICPKKHEHIDYMSKVLYSWAVGSLMYVMVCIRSNVSYIVGVVSMHMNNSCKENWNEVKCIIRYLRGTTTHELCFGGSNTVLHGYFDSYMTCVIDIMRSTTRHAFIVGGTIVSWI
jgi:hypothetical protein